MAGLYVASSIPGEIPEEPTIIQSIFSWFPPTVHNILHIPAYALLAWTLYQCQLSHFSPRVGLPLVIIMAGAYGALLEWHQVDIPGRYASFTDIALNFIGALSGTWIAWKNTTAYETV